MTLVRYIPLLSLLGILVSPLAFLTQCVQVDWSFSNYQTLGKNTLLLFLGTVLVTLPLATLFLIFVLRSNTTSRSIQYFVWILMLAIPLPIQIAGIRSFFSSLHLNNWVFSLQGAILFHSLAGLPWIFLILSLGTTSTQKGWLSSSKIFTSPNQWLVRAITNYCLPAFFLAYWFLLTQIINDISINDLMQIETYSSDIYVQIISSDPSTKVIIPIELFAIYICLIITAYLFYRLWLRSHFSTVEPEWADGFSQNTSEYETPWTFAFLILIGIPLLVFPLYGLVQRSGSDDLHQSWNWLTLLSQLKQSAGADFPIISRNFVVAILTGVSCGIAGSYLAWQIHSGHHFSSLIICILTLLFLLPGPLLGLTTQNHYLQILNYSHGYSEIPANLFWYGPSIFPLLHVHFLRFIPIATCISILGLSTSGKSLFDTGRLTLTSEESRFFRLGILGNRQILFQVMAVIGLLTFGEVAAAKIVSTPGAESYAEMIWSRLHYGISRDLSSSCLLFLFFSLPSIAFMGWRIGFFQIGSSRED